MFLLKTHYQNCVHLCLCHAFFFFTCPYILWLISLGCPFSLQADAKLRFPICDVHRDRRCTLHFKCKRSTPLALQQRRQETETEIYLPMESSVCVRTCMFGRHLRAFFPLVFVGTKKATWRGLFCIALCERNVCLSSIKCSPHVGLKGGC